MRILVAEDERITRATLVRQLEALGHEVAAAENGAVAFEKYQAGEFDVVITDWEMPEVSGVDLIRRIRQTARPGYVYVIMLTSRSSKADLVEGIEAGADDFLSKPFDREELRVRLLAGERIVRLEQALSLQNEQLRQANERVRRGLDAAARVQRAMLPKGSVVTPRVRSAWTYVPTEELAGDAIGLHLIDDRYLVAYVIDVSGHGVPAALLSVTAMHAMEPLPEATSLLRDPSGAGGIGTVQKPSRVAAELNRRFSSENSDGRFMTMILCVLDTHDGRLLLTLAGHPAPIVMRGRTVIPVDEPGGLPIAIIAEEEYRDAVLQLQSGDRFYLFSDGVVEQPRPDTQDSFGEERLVAQVTAGADLPVDEVVSGSIDALAAWAGGRLFQDDVSLVAVEWG
jgi:sigma-B regulation protein RsbU (phosphoserine phosphatase)